MTKKKPTGVAGSIDADGVNAEFIAELDIDIDDPNVDERVIEALERLGLLGEPPVIDPDAPNPYKANFKLGIPARTDMPPIDDIKGWDEAAARRTKKKLPIKGMIENYAVMRILGVDRDKHATFLNEEISDRIHEQIKTNTKAFARSADEKICGFMTRNHEAAYAYIDDEVHQTMLLDALNQGRAKHEIVRDRFTVEVWRRCVDTRNMLMKATADRKRGLAMAKALFAAGNMPVATPDAPAPEQVKALLAQLRNLIDPTETHHLKGFDHYRQARNHNKDDNKQRSKRRNLQLALADIAAKTGVDMQQEDFLALVSLGKPDDPRLSPFI